jgi:hypothetical protein
MTFMDVLSQWLEAYGGLASFGLAMAVFAGSYAFLLPRIPDSTIGQRRALAIFCLVAGLFIGNLFQLPQATPPQHTLSEESAQNTPAIEKELKTFSFIPRLIVGVALAVFIYYSIIQKWYVGNLRALMIVAGGIGLVSMAMLPPVSIIGAILFCILLWFLYRVFIIKASPIPAQFRRKPGAKTGSEQP